MNLGEQLCQRRPTLGRPDRRQAPRGTPRGRPTPTSRYPESASTPRARRSSDRCAAQWSSCVSRLVAPDRPGRPRHTATMPCRSCWLLIRQDRKIAGAIPPGLEKRRPYQSSEGTTSCWLKSPVPRKQPALEWATPRCPEWWRGSSLRRNRRCPCHLHSIPGSGWTPVG